jgi:hypothetical protein
MIHRRFAKFVVLSLIWSAVFTFGASATLAQTKRLGYTIRYLDFWPATSQMKYVRVVIKPIGGPSVDDIDFFVVASNDGYNSGSKVSTKVSIRKGDTSAVGELYVPNMTGYQMSLHTEIDGNLRLNRNDFAKRSYYDYGSNQLAASSDQQSFILASSGVVADESVQFTAMSRKVAPMVQTATAVATNATFPKVNDLNGWYQDANVNFGGGRTFMTFGGFTSPLAGAMSLESLPSRWFAYEGLGQIIITYEDLKLLSKKHPGKLLAIERWVAASGRLIVMNCGDKLEKADDALRLLGDSDSKLRASRNCRYRSKQPTPEEIDAAMTATIRNQSSGINMSFNGMNDMGEVDTTLLPRPQDIKKEKLGPAIDKGIAKDMVSIDFELGQVVCLSDDASDWGKGTGDRWAIVSMFADAAKPSKGDHRVLSSDALRSFGFPEFDEPPRYVFETSILLYLLVIGPLTFFVLKRKHKLNLMFVIVPIISTIFCTVILAYAIFAEGFDTRVNLFTFTELNQRTGRQSTSALAHVYSGMTPSSYRLEGSAYGMVNAPSGGRVQRISWDDTSEEISGGEIRARTSHQVSSRSSGESQEKLVFVPSGDGDSVAVTVRNGFQRSVVAVAFLTDDCKAGEVWLCQDIGASESKAAEKLTMGDAALILRDAIRERAPTTVLAAGTSTRQRTNTNAINYYGSNDIESITTTTVATRLSSCWRMGESTLARFLKSDANDRYFAITDSCERYKMPIPDATVQSEIHVITGVR